MKGDPVYRAVTKNSPYRVNQFEYGRPEVKDTPDLKKIREDAENAYWNFNTALSVLREMSTLARECRDSGFTNAELDWLLREKWQQAAKIVVASQAEAERAQAAYSAAFEMAAR